MSGYHDLLFAVENDIGVRSIRRWTPEEKKYTFYSLGSK